MVDVTPVAQFNLEGFLGDPNVLLNYIVVGLFGLAGYEVIKNKLGKRK